MSSTRTRLLIAVAALSLAALFVLPMWRILLDAPQYPEGLGMLIKVNTVTGIKPNDLANINGLNHYIGMKAIDPNAIPELRVMPWILGGLVALGLLGAMLGSRKVLYAWLGGFVPRLRWPYRSAPSDRVHEIRQRARADLPELF